MIIFLILALAAAILLYAVIMGASAKTQRSGGRGKSRGGSARATGSVSKAEIQQRWDTIMAISRTGASGLKSAVSEADKLFDYVMQKQGYSGMTMADRLKNAQSNLTDRNGVWRAHKLRNALAHEVGFDLVASQANEALRDFERGLKDLKAL